MSFALCFVFANAQDATSYQKPSKEIADLLLAPPTPTISVDGKAQYMLVMERSLYFLSYKILQRNLRWMT